MDLLIELRRRNSAVPVLMISAFADALVEAAVKRLGALDVLKKPIRTKDLVARTAKAVRCVSAARIESPCERTVVLEATLTAKGTVEEIKVNFLKSPIS